MNLFTTDHPMMSQTSWFDAKAHPRLSFVCSLAVLALVFSPVVLFRLCDYVVNDADDTTPGDFPEFWWLMTVGSLFAYGINWVCAVPLVLGYRLLAGKGIGKVRMVEAPEA